MSYDDYTPAPSSGNLLGRSISIDYSKPDEHASQTTGPGFSYLGIREPIPEYPLAADGQRSVNPAEDLTSPPPESDKVRPGLNSSNLMTDGTRNRSWDQYDEKPYSFQDVVRKNVSGYDVGDVSNEESAPSQSKFAERERSDNGTANAGRASLDPLDYVGISLVGRRFKMVNPEAYYVEKDDDLTGFPAPY